MAEVIAESTAKLQLDEETGEMVSKNELKKRMQKRARKAASMLRNSQQTPTTSGQELANVLPHEPAKTEELTLDPDAMFKQGFLAEVYKLRPSEHIVTRFPPEPNGYLHVTLSSFADFLLPKKEANMDT